MAGTDRRTEGEILERTQHETKKPELYKVVLLNDDYTTMKRDINFSSTRVQHGSNENSKCARGRGKLLHVLNKKFQPGQMDNSLPCA